MTNTETSKSIVDKIRGARWWQGSVIEDGALRAVEPALPVGFAYWVVASQTCNLYNKDFEKIRKVEWVAAQAVNQSAPSLRGGRHPRLLEVKASHALGDAWLVCDSQER